MNQMKFVFKMIWLMEILKIQQKEQIPIKSSDIAKNPKHDEYQRGLASMAYTFFDKKSKITDVAMQQMKNLQMNFINQLSENLKKEKYIYINIFSKYAWVVPLKDKKVVTIVNSFQKILDDSKRKPNKIWVDKGSKFYNRSMKSWLEKNDIEMYSTHIEGKSVVSERFIRTLKTKIQKYMTSISKNVYNDKLDDIVDEYNNIYHRTVKIKPVDVKSGNYI